MLIKKADVDNYFAAKRKKRRILQRTTIGQVPAKHSSTGADDTVVSSRSSEDPLKPASEFVLPIRSSGGY